jgi:hypothetical protein
MNVKTRTMYRQGDVLLIAVVASLIAPRRWKKAPREGGRVVLAHGEVTGHSHAIADERAALYVLDDRAAMAAAARELLASVGLTMEVRDEEVVGVLDTPRDAALVHEEHASIPLTNRRHVVIRQREYAPDAIRQVAD